MYVTSACSDYSYVDYNWALCWNAIHHHCAYSWDNFAARFAAVPQESQDLLTFSDDVFILQSPALLITRPWNLYSGSGGNYHHPADLPDNSWLDWVEDIIWCLESVYLPTATHQFTHTQSHPVSSSPLSLNNSNACMNTYKVFNPIPGDPLSCRL